MSDPSPWPALRRLTPARIGLGRHGASLPTREVLALDTAHALARDAVHLPLDGDALAAQLAEDGWSVLRARSAAPDRATYLLRPDLGRRLDAGSAAELAAAAAGGRADADAASAPSDLVVVVGDGLSARAVASHARPLLATVRALAPPTWRVGPVVIAEQARVALGDPIGEAFGAVLVAVLIGERPGLSSPDSLGIYLTWAPRSGRTDAERNCISNVRPEGLPPADAARRLVWLCGEALRRRLTGVALKDGSDTPTLPAG